MKLYIAFSANDVVQFSKLSGRSDVILACSDVITDQCVDVASFSFDEREAVLSVRKFFQCQSTEAGMAQGFANNFWECSLRRFYAI